MDQTDRFSRLQNFKPLETLTATDLRGLDPEDVQFLVNAQMTGNEQQRLMFSQALNHLQGQQQRMDQAKTAVANARTSQELEWAKHQYKQIQQQTKYEMDQIQEQSKFQMDLLGKMASTGNTTAAAKLRTILSTQFAMLQNQLSQTTDPAKQAKIVENLHELSQQIQAVPDADGTSNGLTPYQQWQQDKYYEEEFKEAELSVRDPEIPLPIRQNYARRLNQIPESTIYYATQGDDIVPISLPYNLVNDEQFTMEKINEYAQDLRQSPEWVIRELQKKYTEWEKQQKKEAVEKRRQEELEEIRNRYEQQPKGSRKVPVPSRGGVYSG